MISRRPNMRASTENAPGPSMMVMRRKLSPAARMPIGQFNPAAARETVARIHEIRKGVRLDLQGISIRELSTSDIASDAPVGARRFSLHAMVLRRRNYGGIGRDAQLGNAGE